MARTGKQAKPQLVPDDPCTVYDRDVTAPDALQLADNVTATALADWWKMARIYAEAMHLLNRAVFLQHFPDEGFWYLSSIDQNDPTPAATP